MTTQAHTGLDNEFNEITETIRGRTYLLREVPASEYKKIQDQCLDKIEQPDGSTLERYDSVRERQLLLSKAVISADPPMPEGGINGVGTRAYIALNTLCQQLHFGEPDAATGIASALETERRKQKAAGEDKGKGKG